MALSLAYIVVSGISWGAFFFESSAVRLLEHDVNTASASKGKNNSLLYLRIFLYLAVSIFLLKRGGLE